MIDEILPAAAIAVEARSDAPGSSLFPAEERLLGRAVEKRRREFTTARACARAALGQLGYPAAPILAGERGEPLWPAGAIGSITHCAGYRASAVALRSEILTIGIDAEPNAPLPDGLLKDIARPEERPALRELGAASPDVSWERLLFSAKESVYKAWFPLARRWLGFEDAVLVIDPSAGTFTARLLVEGPLLGDARLSSFAGRWLARDGILLTAIAVAAG